MNEIGRVLSRVSRRLAARRKERALKELKDAVSTLPSRRPGRFLHAIRKPTLSVVMEHKRASPSRGRFGAMSGEPVESIASAYRRAGADAISVLAEQDFFHGGPADVAAASLASGLPVLQKDFVLSEYQVYESALNGSDALLLIEGVASEIGQLAGLCHELCADPVVEVHDERGLRFVLDACPHAVIGINNRNLSTFKVDAGTFSRLSPLVPGKRALVCESGLESPADVQAAAAAGADAVLVGTAFMQAQNIGTLESIASEFAKAALAAKKVGRA